MLSLTPFLIKISQNYVNHKTLSIFINTRGKKRQKYKLHGSATCNISESGTVGPGANYLIGRS